MSDSLLVAAIDFGTTFSGYAFSFLHEYERDRMNIYANTSWIAGGAGLVSWKTPTTILLTPDRKFDSFGYEAEDHYLELMDNEEEEGWYYFQRFKMLLHNKMVLNRDVTIKDIHGREMPARTIFSLSIEYLKNHLIKTLENRNLNITMEDIKWVLTVPAIWNEPAKQFMREAAVMAGISSRRLMLALEPEAASLYCKYLHTEKMVVEGNKTEIVPFKPGTKYMVLDLGGGTVDVTLHQVIDKDTLMELHIATGGAWGGTKVDEAYMNLIEELYGTETIQKFMTDNRPELLDFQREFELRKRTVKELMSGEQKPVYLRFPATLHCLYEEMHGKHREDAIKESRFVGKLSFKRDKISIEKEIFKDLFKDCQESITKHVQNILREPSAEGVSAVIMVGGFSEAKLIAEAVREEFPGLRVIVPEEPGLAVVKGAVLYGHNPFTIISRICKFTYGVAVRVPFVSGYHPENKKIIINGEELCTDAFSPFVQIGRSVKSGDKVIKTYEVVILKAPVTIQVFASVDEYPLLTTGPDCSLLGNVIIKPPVGGWSKGAQVQVEMGFGGTEFTVSARDPKNPIEIYEASFDFLGEGSEQHCTDDITQKLEQTSID